MGWRLRGLVAVALAACLVIFALTRWLVATPALDSPSPPAASVAINGQAIAVDALVGRLSPRWQTDDAQRQRQIEQQRQLADALGRSPAAVHLRGYAGLGLLFWPLCALALLLTLVGAVIALARPHLVNLLYLLMAVCQAGNLLLLAAASVRGIGLPADLVALDMPLRLALDIVTGAAAVHAFALHPRRLRTANRIAAATWAAVALVIGAAWAGWLPSLWWWAQGATLLLGLAAWALWI